MPAMAAVGSPALCTPGPLCPRALSCPPPQAINVGLAPRGAPRNGQKANVLAALSPAHANGRQSHPEEAPHGSADPGGGARALGLALAASLALGLLPGPVPVLGPATMPAPAEPSAGVGAVPMMTAHAEPSAEVGAVFQRSCAGCHAGGGNVLKPGAGLTKEELERNGLLSKEALFDITYKGVGRMPGFGEGCAPKGQCTFGPRLSDDVIAQLADYVLQNAEEGWQTLS